MSTVPPMNNLKRTIIIAALLIGAALLIFLASSPAEAQTTEYGCETYGCVYGHNPTHYERNPDPDEWPKYGIAYELLPDGPDGRYFVEVQWPGDYDPADRPRWDRVAHCESTSRWHIATGNGYYGGLQFSRQTWLAFGGGQYAQYAHHATPEQQIDIATNVAFTGTDRHRPQGLGAWPHCGKRY